MLPNIIPKEAPVAREQTNDLGHEERIAFRFLVNRGNQGVGRQGVDAE